MSYTVHMPETAPQLARETLAEAQKAYGCLETSAGGGLKKCSTKPVCLTLQNAIRPRSPVVNAPVWHCSVHCFPSHAHSCSTSPSPSWTQNYGIGFGVSCSSTPARTACLHSSSRTILQTPRPLKAG